MLPVSLTLAAALGLLSLWLAFRLSRMRMAGKVMIGDGGDPRLAARMRAHANFVEYSPFVLALVVLIELAGAPRRALWLVAALYVVARVAHAFGMDNPRRNAARAGGALVTWLVLLGLSLWAIVIASHAPGATGHVTLF
ncbi:MAPEG family protein [Sphingomonas morindae]|uniref:MAPEG family protein n=1 Tax=Sphingomonas morindae TaxID=1541170 RepID=A0ABY4XBS6_9SPHN|nr:MAPEG family protein [Sphingomonas morindae]USI74150.1 MAPEG family protein [Sphingomonas morindae]